MEKGVKEYQLVLSIFKGANFVVKRPGGIQCKIVGKVNDSMLESQIFHLSTTNSDPDFNYQIAWKLPKKKLQELRQNRGNVRIECHQLTSEGKIEGPIGFCVISVKDAIEITSYEEIDVKNSRVLPLTGTKQPWLQYGPKLCCMLHFEDPDKMISAPGHKRKLTPMPVMKTTYNKQGNKFVTPHPPPPSAAVGSLLGSAVGTAIESGKFVWTVNNDMGYFQLGEPGPDDNLYIMNITLVSVENLQFLLPLKSPALSLLEWRIRFDAFGITIDSENFKFQPLNVSNEEDRRTFLGDKSTARIRANDLEFTRFLDEFPLEMRVETIAGNKVELQGKARVVLRSLIDPEQIEIRSVIDIVPEHVKTVPRLHKPQLSQIVDVKKSPNFFSKNYIKIEDIHVPVASISSSKENLADLEREMNTMSVRGNGGKDEEDYVPPTELGGGGDRFPTEPNPEQSTPSEAQGQPYIDPMDRPLPTTVKTNGIAKETPPAEPASARSDTVSTSNSSEYAAFRERQEQSQSIKSKLSKVKVPPGNYQFLLNFTGFCLRSRKTFKDPWLLTFFHPPFSVGPSDRCVLHAYPKEPVKEKRSEFYFQDDDNERWELSIPRITEELLATPLKVLFFGPNAELDAEEPVGFSHIPIGDLFLKGEVDGRRSIVGASQILRFSSAASADQKPMRVGYLAYNFELREAAGVDSSQDIMLPTPISKPPPLIEDKPKAPSKSGHKKEHCVEEWRVEEDRVYRERIKEKEKAYFQMLAAEHRKQKEESEKVVNEKLCDIESRKQEYEKKLRMLHEKEERLNTREAQLHQAARTSEGILHHEIEDLKLKLRSLEAERSTEMKALKRQLQDAADDLKIAREKSKCLEIKLVSKEEELAKAMSNRNKWPDLESLVKVEKLEQEIEHYKKELKKVTEERDTYRAQNQKLVKALQQQAEDTKEQLRNENENLKLQMIATREQELLNKERKQIEDISQQIRRLQREGQTYNFTQLHPQQQRVHNNSRSQFPLSETKGSATTNDAFRNNDNNNNNQENVEALSVQDQDALLEKEIDRLTRSREGLLKTQAYTIHDPLIRNIEDEILKNLQLRSDLQSEH